MEGFFGCVLLAFVLGIMISFFTDRPHDENQDDETVDKS